MLENLLNFDSLLDQYELASGQRMPDDLAVSTVLRCIDAPTRRHLEMIMDENINYEKLKEKLILLDKNTKSWSGDGFLKNLQQLQNPTTSSSSTSYQGPAPMEVDQVQFGKGKHKGKGKQKGKKGGWFGLPYGGKFGNNKGNFKGKSKNKGKKGNHKGKQKSKNNGKGKGYGNNSNVCRICGQHGHWGNECPNRNSVSQVNNPGSQQDAQVNQAGDGASTTGSTIPRRMSTASTVSSQPTTASKMIRMVKMYNVSTPPSSQPERFEIQSEAADEEDWFSVRMVECPIFDMAASEDVQSSVGEEHDALLEWYSNMDSPMDQVHSNGLDVYHVRAAPLQDGQLVVLDSGADISLLPYDMADRGKCGGKRFSRAVLEDAQGGRLRTYGRRSAQIEVEGRGNDLVIIEDDFVVSSVKCPLVSLGRLLHRGWTMTPNPEAPAGVSLLAPDKQCEIPLQFKRNSLAVFAHIRVVHEVDEPEGRGDAVQLAPTSYPLTCIEEDENDSECDFVGNKPYKFVIQTVVKPTQEYLARIFKRGWTTTEKGNPFCIMPESTKFLDPSILFPWSEWPKRSALIQRPDFDWELVEHCAPYFMKMSYDGEIPECEGKPTMVLTILHKMDEPVSIFGALAGEETVEAGGHDADASSFAFQPEPTIPAELQMEVKPEEVDQPHPGGALWSDSLGNVVWEFEEKDSLVVNGQVVTARSSMAMLRTCAQYLGISRGGAKATLWKRLNQAVQQQEHQRMFETANRLYREEQDHKGLIPQAVPRVPTKEERSLHELTHMPYRSWCDVCVSCKARNDPQRLLDEPQEGRRSSPSIQCDYAFGKLEADKPTITVLVRTHYEELTWKCPTHEAAVGLCYDSDSFKTR